VKQELWRRHHTKLWWRRYTPHGQITSEPKRPEILPSNEVPPLKKMIGFSKELWDISGSKK
jgi:hypothetical protein